MHRYLRSRFLICVLRRRWKLSLLGGEKQVDAFARFAGISKNCFVPSGMSGVRVVVWWGEATHEPAREDARPIEIFKPYRHRSEKGVDLV